MTRNDLPEGTTRGADITIKDLKPGDVFAVPGTPRMSRIGGTITKVNRTTIAYDAEYQPNPEVEVRTLKLKAKHDDLIGGRVRRGDVIHFIDPPKLITTPPASLESDKGRLFIIGGGEHHERYHGDPQWSQLWPISYDGKPAGKLYCNESYGKTADGKPRWQATTRELYWRYAADAPSGPGVGIGYDVAAFDTPEEALAAWGRSADQILDYHERKRR